MTILPKIQCPGCGKNMASVTSDVIPPANSFEDCLRRCVKCGIGATNAKNPAKVRFIQSDTPPELPPAVPPAKS
jgi:hypothetical protein